MQHQSFLRNLLLLLTWWAVGERCCWRRSVTRWLLCFFRYKYQCCCWLSLFWLLGNSLMKRSGILVFSLKIKSKILFSVRVLVAETPSFLAVNVSFSMHSKKNVNIRNAFISVFRLVTYARVVRRGRGGGRAPARFTNRKNRRSRITDIKISFSRIPKISK